MTEGGSHHLKRGDKLILASIRQALEKELGRKPDYRDQARIDAALAEHGIHFHAATEETVKDYVRAAEKRGISHRVRARRKDSERSGD